MAPSALTTDHRSGPAAVLACCLDCGTALDGLAACPRCGRGYPERDGVLEAIGPLTGRNRIAAAFYDGPGWRRFRFWEQWFLIGLFRGGQAGARRQVLRYLPRSETARVLEVGIGDGDNVPLLPTGWEVFGVDIARTRLATCRDRFPELSGRLIWAEGEALPFPEATFDAVFSVGGFNYFRDHEAALREMRRVARPGGPVVVADEVPDLHRHALGAILGFEELDRWALRLMGLDADFVTMVYNVRIDIEGLARRALPNPRRVWIWNRLGYCLVDPDPRTRRPPN